MPENLGNRKRGQVFSGNVSSRAQPPSRTGSVLSLFSTWISFSFGYRKDGLEMCVLLLLLLFFWEKERERKRVRFQGMIMVSHLLLEIFAPAGHFDRYRVEPLDLASKSLSVASGTLYLHRIIRLFFLDYRIFLDLLCMIFIFVLLKRSNGYEKNHVINIETVYPYIYIYMYIHFL